MNERSFRNRPSIVPLLVSFLVMVLLLALGARAFGQRNPVDLSQDYSAITLAAVCLEGDNDSRRGVEAERECEQYIRGFLDAFGALELASAEASLPALCLPVEVDAIDAVRRSFTRWVFENFSERESPAGTMLLQLLQEEYACP